MKKRVFTIGSAAVLLVLAAGAGGLYAYDSSRSDVIAQGRTRPAASTSAGSVPRGRATCFSAASGPSSGSGVVVRWQSRGWTVRASDIDATLGVDRMVREALQRSRSGHVPGPRRPRPARRPRAGRRTAPDRPLAREALRLHRLGRRTGQSSRGERDDRTRRGLAQRHRVRRKGSAVQKRFLAARILRELRNPSSSSVVEVPVRPLRAHVSNARLAYEYQTYITIDRAHFTLRLWKNLKLAKTYRIAVGRQGLETPAGEYAINDRQVNPSWHVPNSAWAGDLAGPRDSARARTTRSRPAGWASTTAPASTAPTRSRRSAPPRRTAASGWRSRTWSSCIR